MNSFSTFWVGNTLGHYEKMSLKSALVTGKEVTLYTYEDLDDIPDGVTQIDASLIMPRTPAVEKMIEMRKFSGMSNIFRYKMLRQKITTWFDLDVIFLKEDFPVSPYIFAYEDSKFINGAVLSYPQNSELSNLLITKATIDEVCSRPHGSTGPKLLSKSVTDLALEGYALPSKSFYPIHWSEPWKFFHSSFFDVVTKVSTDSFAVHLWNDLLKISDSSLKTQRPPRGSYMEHLFSVFDCEMPNLPPLPKSEFDRWRKTLSASHGHLVKKSILRTSFRKLRSNRVFRGL